MVLGPLLVQFAPAAHASEFLADTSVGEALIDFLQGVIKWVEAAGDAGPFFLWVFLACAEMVPLLPTQPLYLSAGLLFGAPNGIFPAWFGVLTAAILSFWLARLLGGPSGPLYGLVKFVMQKESKDDPVGSAELESGLEKVADSSLVGAIGKMILLRLSPVIPFSVSNYLCGLSGMNFLPFFIGTAVGTVPWAVLYVVVGSTGHELLVTGGDLKELLTMVGTKAGAVTGDPRVQAAVLTLTLFLLAVLLRPFLPSPAPVPPQPKEPSVKGPGAGEDAP